MSFSGCAYMRGQVHTGQLMLDRKLWWSAYSLSTCELTSLPAVAALSLSLSLRFNGNFPGKPGLAGVYWSKGWWRIGGGGDNWTTGAIRSCKAPVKSSPPTNQHLVAAEVSYFSHAAAVTIRYLHVVVKEMAGKCIDWKVTFCWNWHDISGVQWMKFTHNNFCTANILLLSMDHEDDSNQKSEVCTELHLVSILLYTTLHLYMFQNLPCMKRSSNTKMDHVP